MSRGGGVPGTPPLISKKKISQLKNTAASDGRLDSNGLGTQENRVGISINGTTGQYMHLFYLECTDTTTNSSHGGVD